MIWPNNKTSRSCERSCHTYIELRDVIRVWNCGIFLCRSDSFVICYSIRAWRRFTIRYKLWYTGQDSICFTINHASKFLQIHSLISTIVTDMFVTMISLVRFQWTYWNSFMQFKGNQKIFNNIEIHTFKYDTSHSQWSQWHSLLIYCLLLDFSGEGLKEKRTGSDNLLLNLHTCSSCCFVNETCRRCTSPPFLSQSVHIFISFYLCFHPPYISPSSAQPLPLPFHRSPSPPSPLPDPFLLWTRRFSL